MSKRAKSSDDSDGSKRAKANDTIDCDYAHYAARVGAAVTDAEIDDLIRTITSDPGNAEILRKLKNNDPNFTCLALRPISDPNIARMTPREMDEYLTERGGIGWLGYFVGQSTNLDRLFLPSTGSFVSRDELLAFFGGLNRNRSVCHLDIGDLNWFGAEFQELTLFFAENKNLDEVTVWREVTMSPFNDELRGGIVRRLSQALRSCTSLKSFEFNFYNDFADSYERDDEHMVEIINSLSNKSQLVNLEFPWCLGRRGYRELAGLLAWEGSQLQSLDIRNCEMDVEDLECLLNAVATNSKLKKLNMRSCWGRGENEDDDEQATLALTQAWGSIELPLLKAFALDLVELDIIRSGGSMDDNGAIAFSHALVGNRKLEVLRADWRQLTSHGWNAVSKLLCDPSRPEATYASNHTLWDLGISMESSVAAEVDPTFQNEIHPLLRTNRSKYRAACAKILATHNFDMQVFFEWEFKMLPIAVKWLAIAPRGLTTSPIIQTKKLSVIYQFVRAAPKLFVECRLRGELEENRARKERIRMEQERMQMWIRMEQERLQMELELLEERNKVIHIKLRGE